ncbi:MAG TPA: DUF1064 domain-containing protein [Phycisphaerae bacterium]|nr:DUF1064 domain-containing protein [Phycisphaerae bacterium]HUX03017.1 DUF1064 domain-containing protein [Phycisphaerae bacterium]
MSFEAKEILGRLPAGARDAVEAQLGPRRKPAGRRKYGNEPTYVDGVRFDSKKEAARYTTLRVLMRAGVVKWFARQCRFVLPGGVEYVCDFIVHWHDGRITVEDVKGGKGTQTKVYRLKKRQVEALYGITVEEL